MDVKKYKGEGGKAATRRKGLDMEIRVLRNVEKYNEQMSKHHLQTQFCTENEDIFH